MIVRFLNRIIMSLVAGYVIYRIAEMNVSAAFAAMVVLLIMTGE